MMADEQITRKIIETVAEEFELEEIQLTPEATLYDDLGLDSLDAVDLVVSMEKAFGVKLTNEEAIKSVRTVGDLSELIINMKNEISGD